MTTIFYILATIAVLLIVLTLLAPKNYHVNRRTLINRPAAEVFEYLKYLRNQDHWSPWGIKDPDMEKSFRGVDGTVGATSIWKGNKEVGEGEQEIKRIEKDHIIESELRFMKPFKSTSDAYIKVRELAVDKTEVTWGFSGEHKFPMRMFMIFMNMDKAVGKDFESGLVNLKNILENEREKA